MNYTITQEGAIYLKEELPQYHFDRDDFCKIFYEIFTSDQIFNLEEECQSGGVHFDYFTLFYHENTFYILHRDSGIMISYYKHLGRINTCNRQDFTLDDFRIFLIALKEDLLSYEIIK